MNEPTIIINGYTLGPGEAMTVRVAIETFAIDLNDDGYLGDDYHSIKMADGYKNCIRNIRSYYLNTPTEDK